MPGRYIVVAGSNTDTKKVTSPKLCSPKWVTYLHIHKLTRYICGH